MSSVGQSSPASFLSSLAPNKLWALFFFSFFIFFLNCTSLPSIPSVETAVFHWLNGLMISHTASSLDFLMSDTESIRTYWCPFPSNFQYDSQFSLAIVCLLWCRISGAESETIFNPIHNVNLSTKTMQNFTFHYLYYNYTLSMLMCISKFL